MPPVINTLKYECLFHYLNKPKYFESCYIDTTVKDDVMCVNYSYCGFTVYIIMTHNTLILFQIYSLNLNLLTRNNIIPVVVFDGEKLPGKRAITDERNRYIFNASFQLHHDKNNSVFNSYVCVMITFSNNLFLKSYCN